MKRDSGKILISGEKAFVIQPSLAKLLGRSAAHILQHIHYALQTPNLGKHHDGQKWVYNTYASWKESIQIYSEITIRRSISKLEAMGILLSEMLSYRKSDRTKWYTLNYDLIEKIAGSPIKNLDKPLKLITSHDQNDQIIIEQRKHTKIKLINHTSSEKSECVVNNLFKVWKTLVAKETDIVLTKKRSQQLMAALKFKFNGCINQWKCFCETIASSDFLMGRAKSTFKASLDWVLKFDIIQRILEGDFGVKKEENWPAQSLPDNSNNNTEQEYIQTQHEPDEIKKLRVKLLQRIGSGGYRSWFKHTSFVKHESGFAVIKTGSFWKNYVITHYNHHLLDLHIKV